MYVFKLQELEDATENFSSSRLIGKGSHGSVYRGILKNGNHVAIKKQSSTGIKNEALILSSIHPHPCIIKFLGISHDSNHIVTEYMSNGMLHHLLHYSKTPPSWPKRVEIAVHLARGLSWLHESNPPIVHRDIKSANILFDENWDVKLADFGLAVQLSDEHKNVPPAAAGTIGYIDPSYTNPSNLSTKIDVFSYGVVLLELISGRDVIAVTESPSCIVDWALRLIREGRVMDICYKRVQLPLYMDQVIRKLLELTARCLSPKASNRPSMSEVVVILESLIIMDLNSDHSQFSIPKSMNYVGDMVISMMRRKICKFSGKFWEIVMIMTSGVCGEH